jgi:hypothetical protein
MNAAIFLRTPVKRRFLPRATPKLFFVYQLNHPNTPNLANLPIREFSKSTRFSMKEAIVAKGPKVTLHDVPVPKPKAGQVLIKVIYSGSNPKDWKRPSLGEPHNSGDDIAGVVESVGENVTEFKQGDRVAAFHEMVRVLRMFYSSSRSP